MKKVRWGNWFLTIVGGVIVVLFLAWLIPMLVRSAKATPLVSVPKETVIVRQTVVVRETVVVDRFVTTTPAAPSATPTLAPSATNSPTSAPQQVASSITTSTVSVTSTNSGSGTVGSGSGLVHPVFFEGQSSGKEYTASYDVGVKPGQVGIAFGYSIEWQGRVLGYPTDKCGLVILLPGWYERFSLSDGRYEVYDLPSTNQEFWIKDLARQRAEEQTNHYGCSMKDPVSVWDSDKPAVVWSLAQVPTTIVSAATMTPTVKFTATVTSTQKITVTAPAATATQQARERIISGKDGTAKFVQGDSVIGWKIVMDDGRTCEGGCFLPLASGPGTVSDGVINPWPQEIPQGQKAWKPS